MEELAAIQEISEIKTDGKGNGVGISLLGGFTNTYDLFTVGAEVSMDISRSKMGYNESREMKVSNDIGFSFLGRGGITLTENVTTYLTLGLSLKNYEVTYNGQTTQAASFGQSFTMVPHFVIGLGGEVAINRKLALFAELNYIVAFSGLKINALGNAKVKTKSQQLRLGTRYYFNDSGYSGNNKSHDKSSYNDSYYDSYDRQNEISSDGEEERPFENDFVTSKNPNSGNTLNNDSQNPNVHWLYRETHYYLDDDQSIYLTDYNVFEMEENKVPATKEVQPPRMVPQTIEDPMQKDKSTEKINPKDQKQEEVREARDADNVSRNKGKRKNLTSKGSNYKGGYPANKDGGTNSKVKLGRFPCNGNVWYDCGKEALEQKEVLFKN